jgi:hypothetical protein
MNLLRKNQLGAPSGALGGPLRLGSQQIANA